jgi:hypothetical protein
MPRWLVLTDQHTARADRLLRLQLQPAEVYGRTLEPLIADEQIIPVNVGDHGAVY